MGAVLGSLPPVSTTSRPLRASRDEPTARTPAPLSIHPDQNWDGIDGAWSTFTLRIGSPQQFVRTLVSFNAYQTWAVVPEGCMAAQDQQACADARGSLFQYNVSTTFDRKGIYDIWLEQRLGLDGNAIFGYDVVGLGGVGEEGPTLPNTTVGGLAVNDYYLGVFGVNPKPTNFTSFNDGSPSYMSMLYEENYIPSVSFGYTGGAKYRSTGVLASLTLGGYDTSKFIENGITFNFAPDNERDLVVAIQSIETPSQIDASSVPTKLLPAPIYAFVDSTVPHIWLPMEACSAFELEFGLIYDNTTSLYLVNDTLHNVLLDRNASITFQLAQGFEEGPSVLITFPYAAFDLEAQPPYQGLTNTSRYFPLSRAANESQYTLGRTFMQEAYISVDWQSGKFNLSQASWELGMESQLMPIIPNNSSDKPIWIYGGSDSDENGHSNGGLSAGAIVGSTLGGVACIAVIAIVLVYYFRRKRRKPSTLEGERAAEGAPSAAPVRHQHGWTKSELDGFEVPVTEHKRLLSANISLPNSLPGTPNSGTSRQSPAYLISVGGHSTPPTPSAGEGSYFNTQRGKRFSLSSPLPPLPIEADSRQQQIHEVPGDMPAIREKDGKALSEKEALAHRERMYNGVDVAANSDAAVRHGLRGPRRVRPEDVVRADLYTEQGTEPRRRFSFEEEDSSRQLDE